MKKIIQISDCHYNLDSDKNTENLIHTLNYISKMSFDYLFITGDICESPSIKKYENFYRIISKYIKFQRVYAIAGNHDDLDMMKTAFHDTLIKIDNNVMIEDINFLFIDSSLKPIKNMKLGAGRIGNNDIEKIYNSTKETAIVVHHPIFKNDCEWFDNIGIENQEEVANAVLKNKKIKNIICGHGHSFIENEVEHITQTMSPSTSYGFDHNSKTFKKNNNFGAVMLNVDKKDITYKEIKIPIDLINFDLFK
ncbi:metallophosphoesterase [Photobacterium angustum]|uniref:metallophosphoesterase family protein n=1 Tax=Photobacterium angustum TaxID=661 RepID=UPI003D14C8B7